MNKYVLANVAGMIS